MRDNVDTRGVMKIPRKHTGRGTLFSRIISHISRASPTIGINHFYELRGHGSLIRFYLRTKPKPIPPPPPLSLPSFPPFSLSSLSVDFIQRGIIKLIVFRQCQKQYAIGYRVRFNRRNTTSIDVSCDISIHGGARNEFLKYPGIVNQQNIFTKWKAESFTLTYFISFEMETIFFLIIL